MCNDNGGQAFPQPVAYTPLGQEVPSYPGMTLRDYFAAKAMQSMAINATKGYVEYGNAGSVARRAYEFADAMLAERQKGGDHA